MSDRDLLELAAKAAGIKLHIWGAKGSENFADMAKPGGTRWNPIADDGDAFRLVIKLKLSVEITGSEDETYEVSCGAHWESFFFDEDGAAATRRVIICAAADIGKSMP